MRITDIKTDIIASSISEELPTSYGRRTHFTFVTVEIETDEGISGFGESVGLFHKTAETFIQTEIKPLLLGEDPLQIEYLNHRLEHLFQWISFAAYPISAVDMALYDLKGKVHGVPVYELLGGLYRRDIAFSGLIHINTVEEDVRTALHLVENSGFQTLKVKVGRDPREDEERVRAIREAVGKETRIRLDPNMAWSPRTAVRIIHRLEKYNLEYIEQPVPGWDIEGMKEVARAVDVPLCADESCQSPQDALRLAEARACEVFCPYVSEAGGLTRLKQLLSIADTAGIHCALGTWGESGIGFAAGLHVITSSRNFSLASDQGYSLLNQDYVDKPFVFQNGKVTISNQPGLGVTPDARKMSGMKELAGLERAFQEKPGSRFIPISRSVQL